MPEPVTLAVVLAGALVAGFTSGFAGFGTGLVASGLWFHVLPAPWVPPLVALASVAAQLVGLVTVRHALDWRAAAPFLAAGAVGVPFGVAVLAVASPAGLRASIGAFLVAYGLFQLAGLGRRLRLPHAGRGADTAVGLAGGFLGGFAGLSGAPMVVWLQLRGGTADRQRAVYQPFNLVVLALASGAMVLAGQVDAGVLGMALLCLPVTLLGALLGARLYRSVAERTFRQVVLVLLLVSGAVLVGQSLAA